MKTIIIALLSLCAMIASIQINYNTGSKIAAGAAVFFAILLTLTIAKDNADTPKQ